MQTLFHLVYTLAFLGYILLTLFIVYHIARFSMNKRVAVFVMIFFITGTILLLISNAILFFSIPLESFTLPGLSTSSF